MTANQALTSPERSGGEVVNADAGTIMDVIARAAADPSVDVAKLERLAALYERIKANEAKAAYMAALAAMQPDLPAIERRGRIKIKPADAGQPYALWEDINEAIKPILNKHHFSLSFRVGLAADGKITVTGVLAHAAGHQEETTITLPHDSTGSKNAVQAVGSSTSYGKRYTAGALLNLTFKGEDDDGKAAGIGETITEEQVKTLQSAIMEVDADLPKFLRYMKVERLEDLPASKYQDALAALQAKRKGAKA